MRRWRRSASRVRSGSRSWATSADAPKRAPERRVGGRRAWRVDREDLDAAITGIRPALRLRIMPELDPIVISFASIDDFHPDALVDRVHVSPASRARCGRAASRRGAQARSAGGRSAQRRACDGRVAQRGRRRELARRHTRRAVAGAGRAAPVATARRSGRVHRQAVRRHLVQEPSARETDAAKRTEELLSAALRVLLHHPSFQAVESLWRAVELLVRRVETGETAEIHLFDVTKEEVVADAAGIQQMLMASGRAWSLLAAVHTYGPEDAQTLASLAAVGKRLGAPCRGRSPTFAGVESFAASPDEEDWSFPAELDSLRQSSDGSYLALVLPRFLARESYGKRGIQCERLAFEEFPSGEREHASCLLWANGAILCALAIGARVAEGDAAPTRASIDGLPLEIATVDGDAVAIPCAEASLGQSEVERLLDHGLTPLASMRDSATVIIPRIQSVAQPPRPLPIRTY